MSSLRAAALALLVILAAAAPAAAAPSTIAWHRCAFGAQCSRVVVPRDYANPHAGTVSLAVTRLRARDRKHRIGSLFVNFGGPGATAVDTVQQTGASLFHNLNRRFDIVGFDPRGVGASRPAVDCHANQETQGVYAKPLFRPGFSAAKLLRRDRAYVKRCVARNKAILPYLTTGNTARDMDRLRAAVGDQRLSYLGFSYGSFLGATYQSMFPGRVRALVLDGADDPDDYVNHPFRTLDGQTRGFERALSRFFAACNANQRACLGFGAGHSRRAFDRLVRRLNRHPLRPRSGADRRAVDGDDVLNAALSAMYLKQAWTDLASALMEGQLGHTQLLRAQADDAYGYIKRGRYTPDTDRYFLLSAAEQHYPRKTAPFFREGRASFRKYHHFWWNHGYDELDWGLYPVRGIGVFRGPFRTRASDPTTLVVGTTFDPATPYHGNVRAAHELGNARLLTMRGDGHTAYGGNSKCIDNAVDAYLLRGVVPPKGKKCNQTVPFAQPAVIGSAGASSLVARTLRHMRVLNALRHVRT